MSGRLKFGVAGAVLGLVAALTIPSLAQSTPSGVSARTVTVSGTATIRTLPDEAVVSLGVQTQAATAEASLRDNSTKMNAVIGAITGDGVNRDDVQTSGLSLSPTYGSSGQVITGYDAMNDVTVTIRDIGKTGPIIDDAVKAGANVAGGVSFQLSDQNQGLDQALKDAVTNARTKAEALASAGGASLGQVVRIDETNAQPPVFEQKFAAATAAESTPIQPGVIESQVSVTVVWQLV